MDFSKLNKKITLQKRIKDTDENGFDIVVWKDIYTVWASIKNINGKEYFLAQQQKPKATKKATIRYKKELDQSLNPDISLEYRVLYKDFPYNISYSDNIKEENKFIELLLETE